MKSLKKLKLMLEMSKLMDRAKKTETSAELQSCLDKMELLSKKMEKLN
jgi:hypothetical protein